ncbi:MAG TPA: biopolymer transporter ExbD [Mucilaginibacter sp.]|nr:biopolymer transporter ExbD [Mucilaginibacter sp.]
MSRIKIPRKSTAIDMTAMCDVAFLLLTFFILTAKLKQEDPLQVDTPAATTKVLFPDIDVATITVGKGKVFFGAEGTDVRMQMLEAMGTKYNQTFTPEEKKRFSQIPTFGVPMNQLKQFINLSEDQKKKYTQPGIQVDTTSTSELYNWIHEARVAVATLRNKPLRFAIKGDAKQVYPEVKIVIDMLQKQSVNKFSLITSLKDK